ncbi:MAG: NAD-dependent deacylase [Chloroflexota bacterium]|nr:NAD-dependent deacylase [Chloroflexota bacterium]
MNSRLLQQAITWLRGASSIVVLTGAGVSKESGVPTFRDAQSGLWAKYDPQTLASPEGFRADPGLVWRWYAGRRTQLDGVAPNPAHRALARLGELKPVTLITQNVDGLHQQAGSQNVLELHGSLQKYKCLDRRHPVEVEEATALEEPPSCPRCGSPVRPDVVWFGEMLPATVLDEATEAALTCDLMLVVGTSGIVQPAASLPLYAAEQGAHTIEVNPETTPLTPYLDLHLRGAAGTIVPRLVAGVEAQQEESKD